MLQNELRGWHPGIREQKPWSINPLVAPSTPRHDKQKVSIRNMKIEIGRKSGFTLLEIMIVVAVIGLLAAIAIPNFVRARQTSQTNTCINNLRQIDAAKQHWALENGKQPTDTPAEASLNPYIGRNMNGADLYCPLSKGIMWGGYSAGINAVNVLPACANYTSTGHRASLNPASQ